jgi:DNA-binding MarR family transcriptional regulator
MDENDLRAYRVYLTEKGKEIRYIIFKKLTSFVDTLSDFTYEEKEILRLLIHKASIKLLSQGSSLHPTCLIILNKNGKEAQNI